jgi:carbonic anhydrase
MMHSEFAHRSIARRTFLRQAGATGLLVTCASMLGGWAGVAGAGVLTAPAPNDAPADPDAALARLLRGNRRFVRDRAKHPVNSAERRRASAGTQTPFAAILACADSRVPPEIVFDQGLGDLFVVRVAGNLPGPDEIASLAYAAEHVGVDLILVVGHEGCGAVKTTIEVVEGKLDPGEYAPLTDAITPAVEAAQRSGASGADLLPQSIEENVRLVTVQIPDRSPAIATEIQRRQIAVVGSLYHLKTGKVTLL